MGWGMDGWYRVLGSRRCLRGCCGRGGRGEGVGGDGGGGGCGDLSDIQRQVTTACKCRL
jgi:hypothetical protein